MARYIFSTVSRFRVARFFSQEFLQFAFISRLLLCQAMALNDAQSQSQVSHLVWRNAMTSSTFFFQSRSNPATIFALEILWALNLDSMVLIRLTSFF